MQSRSANPERTWFSPQGGHLLSLHSQSLFVKPLENPENLNAFQTYRQACNIAAHTSRGNNPDWHKPAHEVDLQWHLRITGSPRVRSAVHSISEGKWSNGPKLNLPNLRSQDAIETAVNDLLSSYPNAKSLGVVLHIADEFATTEIFEDFRDWDALSDLNEQLITNPNAVIGEDSAVAEETSWRVVPTPGAITPPICTTVAISHRYAEFLQILRQLGETRNFPILTEGLSAPLAFISVLPAFLDFTTGDSQLVVLHYLKFSALAIFSPAGELIKLRALPHRGRPHPPNISDTLATAIAASELSSPRIVLIPMTTTEIEPLVTQLQATLDLEEELMIDIVKPGAQAATKCDETRPEMLIAQKEYQGVELSNTFRMLGQEGWSMQDFLSQPKSITSLQPSWQDLKLLNASKIAKPVLALVAIAVLAFALFRSIGAMTQPSWQHDENSTALLQAELGQLGRTNKSYQHWDNLLSNRSTGWTTMELIAQMFPADSGVVINEVDYSTRVDSNSKSQTSGFTREWEITGVATEDSLALLQKLNSRAGIQEVFTTIAEHTGVASFDPSPDTRQLLVVVERSENTQYDPDAPLSAVPISENCPYRITIRVTQQFSEKDPLAITKAPQP